MTVVYNISSPDPQSYSSSTQTSSTPPPTTSQNLATNHNHHPQKKPLNCSITSPKDLYVPFPCHKLTWTQFHLHVPPLRLPHVCSGHFLDTLFAPAASLHRMPTDGNFLSVPRELQKEKEEEEEEEEEVTVVNYWFGFPAGYGKYFYPQVRT